MENDASGTLPKNVCRGGSTMIEKKYDLLVENIFIDYREIGSGAAKGKTLLVANVSMLGLHASIFRDPLSQACNLYPKYELDVRVKIEEQEWKTRDILPIPEQELIE